MLIQPFVENAVWHGVAPANRNGHIVIHFETIDEKIIQITITDNGVGLHFKQDGMSKAHVSRGIQLAKDRMRMLSENNRLEIEELVDADSIVSGTRVCIQLDLS